MSSVDSKQLLSILALTACFSGTAHALTVEELAAQFEAYKKEQDSKFEQLSAENRSLKQQNDDLKSQIQNTRQQVENNTVAVESVSENMSTSGGGSNWFDRTSIGGYGELHYQNRSVENGEHKEEVDFHRFVLFFGHEFTDDLRFFSELELEHSISGDGQNGEIELEQAYLEYDLTEQASAKAGLFLVPVGILNETHEPDTFYGVERNEVERYIIPTTWWEAGIGGNYRFDNGVSVEAAVMSGLEVGSNVSIRGGRGKVSEQTARDPIIVGRVKYTGMPGLELAGTILHQTELAQSDPSVDLGSATLYETHAIYHHPVGPGTLGLKALYSRWEIDMINDNDDAQTQYGWYVEPSYRIPTSLGDVGFYGRYQKLDYYSGSNREYDIWEGGANWWLHENVVLKATYIFKENSLVDNADESGFDLGIGYSF